MNFPLSPAQAQALRMLSEGHTIKGAAKKLGVGEDALKDRVRTARYKLGARTNEQAAVIAVKQGLI